MGLALNNAIFLAPCHQLLGTLEGHFTSPLEYHFLEHLLSENGVAKNSKNRNALLIPALGPEYWQACQHYPRMASSISISILLQVSKGESMKHEKCTLKKKKKPGCTWDGHFSC